MIRISPRAQVGDVLLVDFLADNRSQARLDKMKSALSLLQEHSSWRYRQIQRYLQRVIVMEGGGGLYDLDLRVLFFDAQVTESQTSSMLAAALVHEATHERIRRHHLIRDPANRERVERIAVRAQIDFLTYLGDIVGAETVSRAAADKTWWTEESAFARHVDHLAAQGAPRWMVRLYRTLFG